MQKSEMQRKEKGKWVQWNRLLDFPRCILWLSTLDIKTIYAYNAVWRLVATFFFFFCMLLPPFPSSCGPTISTEPQGAGGRPPGWAGQLPPQHHLSPTAPAELLPPRLPPRDPSLATDVSALSQKVGRAQQRRGAHHLIRGHSNMNTIPGGVLHLP